MLFLTSSIHCMDCVNTLYSTGVEIVCTELGHIELLGILNTPNSFHVQSTHREIQKGNSRGKRPVQDMRHAHFQGFLLHCLTELDIPYARHSTYWLLQKDEHIQGKVYDSRKTGTRMSSPVEIQLCMSKTLWSTVANGIYCPPRLAPHNFCCVSFFMKRRYVHIYIYIEHKRTVTKHFLHDFRTQSLRKGK